jgi:sugar lactone lactonase YvrE
MTRSTFLLPILVSLLSAALSAAEDHPPIPIRFTLERPGHVTLVVEDAAGRRVRNLVAETPFAAGAHTVGWDGLDETPGNFRGPVYDIQGRPVGPGRYQVRGLVRDALSLTHEFTVYNAGQPPWRVGKHGDAGEWLADHSAPSAVLYVPEGDGQPARMLIGSQVAEQGDGLVWTDLDGRKVRGAHGVGGAWTGAHFLTRDDGAQAVPGVYAYTASTWKAKDETRMELRLLALRRDGKTPALIAHQFPRDKTQEVHGWDTEYNYLGGIAARDGVVLVGFQRSGTLLVVDAAQQQLLATLTLPDVRGMAFDGEGRLLALSGTRLLRAPAIDWRSATALPAFTTLVAQGLDDPRQVVVGPDRNVYLTDRGRSHCVKVFAGDGKPVRTIGKAGVPSVGPYDPERMHNPQGLGFSADGRLWVAEEDHAPKRISVWNADGKLLTAFYGPAKYGGGGNLSADRTRFYYHDSKNGSGGGMEFALDWQAGTWRLHSIYHRFAPSDWKIPANLGYAGPQLPIDVGGVRYLTNAFNTNPTQGADLVGIWRLDRGVARLLAAVGDARDWPLLRTAEFASLFPTGLKDRPALVAWADLDDDGAVEPAEIQVCAVDGHTPGTWYVAPDLSLMDSFTARLVPTRFTAGGAPVYDLAMRTPVIANVTHRWSSGGAQSFPCSDGWTVVTGGPMRGYRGGELVWAYPSRWPSLHASHEAPRRAQLPGELIGTTRLLGHPVRPPAGEAGEIWALNGNPGVIHLLTTDGLYVGTLGRDRFQGRPWPAEATRGADLSAVWFFDEHFWPTINQGSDGRIHLLVGKNHNSIVRVDGLESVRRLPATTLEVTAAQVAAAEAWRIAAEQRRQQGAGRQTLTVTLRDQAPVVDGDLGEWDPKRFVTIYRDKLDGRQVAITGALAVHGDRLFAAVRGFDDDLLTNTGDTPTMAFKTGGALDLMLGVDGNQRLLVTRQQGRTLAMRYRQQVAGTPDDQRVPFSSPTRTVWFDRVEDVSAVVVLAAKGDGYEFSIPLATLALSATEGTRIAGDLGVLRGTQGQTIQRLYWHNQATSITADVPSEAMLTPALWGDLVFAR